MSSIDCQRPPALYRYSQQAQLERALTLGEFCLRPAADHMQSAPASAGEPILPFRSRTGTIASHATFLTLSMAKAWDEALFDEFDGAECCLVIHRAEEFGERIHRAAARMLPNWAGIDAAVSYGVPSPLGAAFSKPQHYARQREWLFAWRPINPTMALSPVTIRIGAIDDIAELRRKGG